MASYRIGIGSFNLKDGNIGIGTETTGFGNLKVEGTIKTTDLDVGVSTFTRYAGFEGEETASANTARERLQLVLAHDRVDMSSLTTDLLDKMRKEILDVVAKYVEIDFDEVAVSLETEDRMTALVANLPIKRTITGEIKFKKNDKNDKSQKDIKK